MGFVSFQKLAVRSPLCVGLLGNDSTATGIQVFSVANTTQTTGRTTFQKQADVAFVSDYLAGTRVASLLAKIKTHGLATVDGLDGHLVRAGRRALLSRGTTDRSASHG